MKLMKGNILIVTFEFIYHDILGTWWYIFLSLNLPAVYCHLSGGGHSFHTEHNAIKVQKDTAVSCDELNSSNWYVTKKMELSPFINF